jgi:hypothetical protein
MVIDAAERMTPESLRDLQAAAHQLVVVFMYVSPTTATSTVVPDDHT